MIILLFTTYKSVIRINKCADVRKKIIKEQKYRSHEFLFCPKNSCESRHLFHRDIDAIDFPRVYSRWCRTTASAAFHISAEVTVNVGFQALMLTSHAILAARSLFARYRLDHGKRRCRRIGEKHLKSVCSSGTHRKSYAPLLAPFHMLLRCPSLSFSYFCLPLLCFSSIAAREIQENPREIALSLTRETKVSRKEGRAFEYSRRGISLDTQVNCYLLFFNWSIDILKALYCI